MNRKFFLAVVLVFVLAGTWGVMFGVQRAQASETTVIRIDGSIDPSSANITTSDNITYVFTDYNFDSLVIERSDIVVDGMGYRLEGAGYGDGITLDDVSNVTIRNLEVIGFDNGIYLYNTSNNAFHGNNVTGNYIHGFYIYDSSNVTLYENMVSNNGEGAYHGYASIYVAYSSNCSVRLNNITENRYLDGIEFWGSSRNYVYDNNISDNYFGIRIFSSNDNTFYGNDITANSHEGFWLSDSSNNTLYENLLSGNGYGFNVQGYEFSHYLNYISASNLVDEKPVYYLINQNNQTVNASTHLAVGWLAFINSTNVRVEGLNLTKNGQGLLLAYTNNSRIIGNTIVGNYDGLLLFMSVNNVISGNEIARNNYRGIYFYEYSDNNEILENNIIDNVGEGIYLSDSSNNVLYGNTIANSEYGIELYGVDNEIYLNNFVNNTQQVDSGGFSNSWDNSIEGNYWSDYNGTDYNFDGIGDVWVEIDTGNVDHYPLMGMFNSFNTSMSYRVNVISNSTIDGFECFEGNSTIVMHVSNMTANQT
ncbi:MAG: right-handed parallel beta-helix repeat-containing protein, partial [Candidatus Bathyarchaeota archaeon]